MRILYIFWFRPEIATASADVRRESIGMPMSEVLRDYVKTLIGNGRAIEPHPLPAINSQVPSSERALLIPRSQAKVVPHLPLFQ